MKAVGLALNWLLIFLWSVFGSLWHLLIPFLCIISSPIWRWIVESEMQHQSVFPHPVGGKSSVFLLVLLFASPSWQCLRCEFHVRFCVGLIAASLSKVSWWVQCLLPCCVCVRLRFTEFLAVFAVLLSRPKALCGFFLRFHLLPAPF